MVILGKLNLGKLKCYPDTKVSNEISWEMFSPYSFFCYHLNMATGSLVGWQNFSSIFSFCCIKNLINKMKSSFVPVFYGYHFYLWGNALDARS